MSDNSKNLSSTKDLKRVLGFWDLMAVGIGSIIGSGIMSLTGVPSVVTITSDASSRERTAPTVRPFGNSIGISLAL